MVKIKMNSGLGGGVKELQWSVERVQLEKLVEEAKWRDTKIKLS